jgi:fatty acid desaturase
VGKWRFIWEYLLVQLLPHKTLSYLKGRAEYVTFAMNMGEPVRDTTVLYPWALNAMRVVYYSSLAFVAFYFSWWPYFLLLWVVPMLTFYPAVLFLREIAHHGNYPDNGDYTNSRVYEGHWLEREIFFPFGERNHVLHHMFPTIPWHKIMEAHDVMMRFPPYRENVVFCDGFFFKGDRTNQHPTVLEVLAVPSNAYLKNPASSAVSDGIRQSTAQEVGAVEIPVATWHGGES